MNLDMCTGQDWKNVGKPRTDCGSLLIVSHLLYFNFFWFEKAFQNQNNDFIIPLLCKTQITHDILFTYIETGYLRHILPELMLLVPPLTHICSVMLFASEYLCAVS